MFKSKLSKIIVSLLRRIAGVTRSGAKRLMRAMLQALMAMGRRARLPVAGFVLPTVTMVLLVVILLTVAITLRSFDRANTARNVRVNQQVLAAATPALDRAKAKIEYMLREDPQIPPATPSDAELYRIMSFDGKAAGKLAQADLYTFEGEERLVLTADLGKGLPPSPNPQGPLIDPITKAENTAINTAWRYPVDTNNDGKFDTYTLYGIFFRTPARDSQGNVRRSRKSLEARTPPMSIKGLLRPECALGEGTSASLVGDSGWYKIDGRLKKSFFVYTVNVPITNTAGLDNKYEVFKGTPSISALEYQQDQSRIPLSNNAVVYKDDLDISPGVALNMNGRIVTNSNLLVSSGSGTNGVKLHQVSSPQSCFYDQENSKIVVAGNVVSGNANTNNPGPAVQVHLFKTNATPDQTPSIDQTNQSVTNNSLQVLYNNNAYANRIALLVASRKGKDSEDPVSVQQAMAAPLLQKRDDALQAYFEERTRKVPFAEASLGASGLGTYTVAAPPIPSGAIGNDLRPVPAWILPTGGTATSGTIAGPTNLTLVANQLRATNPLPALEEETFLGDRVLAGNNLPAQRWDDNKKQFIGSDTPQFVDGSTPWDAGGGARTRSPQITRIADVGATDRDGFWEQAAAQIPKTAVDGIGGLRVVTSAGVYERKNSFLPLPLWDDPSTATLEGSATYDDPATPGKQELRIVWPDSMPMSPVLGSQLVYNNGATDTVVPSPNSWATVPLPNPDATSPTPLPAAETPTIDPNTPKYAKGDLRMRATAVYHYAQGGGYDPSIEPRNLDNVRPIACISSYYDPSTAVTARNITKPGLTLPDVSGLLPSGNIPTTGRSTTVGSNNGVVYPPPPDRTLDPATPLPGADGLLGGAASTDELQKQANYVFPDGRFANEPLRVALLKSPKDRNLADKAAIDSTMCALEILKTPINFSEVAGIKHGAIQEVAFLNAREVKAIERDDLSTPVDETFTLSSPLSPAQPATRNLQAAWLKGNYNLALEDREPLEIRATQLNIEQLRKTGIATPLPDVPKPEWLLPNSGIIFATRDDALPDRSDRTQSTTTPGTIDENTSKLVSPTDSLLDPTRKPSGIVLVEGQRLFRGPDPITKTVTDVVKEKGLTLVSNLPVYIKGNFNLHGKIDEDTKLFTQFEEFDQLLDKPTATQSGWGNFYTRTTLSKNFACRNGDPRLQCGGDFWRQANVLADAVTVLSDNYRFGFRNEGDFDLRNNAGSAVIPFDANADGTIALGEVQTLKVARLFNGFFTNNFVTNGLTSGAFNSNGLMPSPRTGTGLLDSNYLTVPSAPNADQVGDSSYFNNFVTPVQRRGNFPQYLMEVCVKLPLAACGPNDWFINPPSATRPAGIKASDTSLSLNQTYATSNSLTDGINFKAGTTVDPPVPELQRFPRRVAFQRNVSNNQLPNASPQPLGINGGRVAAGAGTPKANSLWFAAANGAALSYNNNTNETPYLVNTNGRDGNGSPLPLVPPTAGAVLNVQPLLLPVLQIQVVVDADAGGVRAQSPPQGTGGTSIARNSRWMPPGANTTQNMIVGSGDTPSRQLTTSRGDFNGGLQNLPRFLENWNNGGTTSDIKGSFIQLKRSAYNTAPYVPIMTAIPPSLPSPASPNPTDPAIKSLFFRTALAGTPENIYRTDNNLGTVPFFSPPLRNWGYDVGMLSQPPDLFTQRFTTPPTTTKPAEYFREVPRNDEWVNTLMCAKTVKDNAEAVGKSYRTGCPN